MQVYRELVLRKIMKKRRRGAACRRLPQRTQRSRRNKSFREFLRKS